MSVFERFLDARQQWIDEHRTLPRRVYVSRATAARLTNEMNAISTQDVPPLGTLPPGVIGWAGGCEWHEDAAMGDGFRFEMVES